MMGRAAAIAVSTRKKKSKARNYLEQNSERSSDSNGSGGKEEKIQLEMGDMDIIDDANVKNMLNIRRYPWALWIAGGVILIASIYMLYHLTLGKYGALFSGYTQGQYLLNVFFFILSFLFFYRGKVESISFNKNDQMLKKSKTTILCRKAEETYRLSDINTIRILKKGHEGINVYTIHYKVVILFDNQSSIQILETGNKEKAKRQLFTIKTFLYGMCAEKDLKIIDESSSVV